MDERIKIESISVAIVDASVRVHRTLGGGLLESTYQRCLHYELQERGFSVESEKAVPIRYRAITNESGLRPDMVIESRVIVENKFLQTLLPVHEAQCSPTSG